MMSWAPGAPNAIATHTWRDDPRARRVQPRIAAAFLVPAMHPADTTRGSRRDSSARAHRAYRDACVTPEELSFPKSS